VVTICPPSAGTDGRRRDWNGTWDLAPLPEPLLKELDRLLNARHLGSPRRVLLSGQVTEPYAAAALRREAGLVRGAAPGTRNRALNRAAYCLGQLVASGVLERGVVEAELAGAALAAGLPVAGDAGHAPERPRGGDARAAGERLRWGPSRGRSRPGPFRLHAAGPLQERLAIICTISK